MRKCVHKCSAGCSPCSPAISGDGLLVQWHFPGSTFPPLTKVLSFIGCKGICPYESSVSGEIGLGKLSIVIGPILKLMSSVGQRKSELVCCRCLCFCFVETRLHCVAGLPWNSNQSCLVPQVLSFTGMSYHTLLFVTSCFLSQDKFPKGRIHLSVLI